MQYCRCHSHFRRRLTERFRELTQIRPTGTSSQPVDQFRRGSNDRRPNDKRMLTTRHHGIHDHRLLTIGSCPPIKTDWRNPLIAGLAGALLVSLWEHVDNCLPPASLLALSGFPQSSELASVNVLQSGGVGHDVVLERPPPRFYDALVAAEDIADDTSPGSVVATCGLVGSVTQWEFWFEREHDQECCARSAQRETRYPDRIARRPGIRLVTRTNLSEPMYDGDCATRKPNSLDAGRHRQALDSALIRQAPPRKRRICNVAWSMNMDKILVWLVGTAYVCLFPIPSAAQNESGVVADALIVLAEVPLRVYLRDGRLPLDLPSLPELVPMSHIPMGDHPQLPDTMIATVANRGTLPVDNVEIRLFVDRQVGEAVREGQLFEDGHSWHVGHLGYFTIGRSWVRAPRLREGFKPGDVIPDDNMIPLDKTVIDGWFFSVSYVVAGPDEGLVKWRQ